MNTYFRFEQPWFLLLAALLPLFWFLGRRLQRPPVIRFAAACLFEQQPIFDGPGGRPSNRRSITPAAVV